MKRRPARMSEEFISRAKEHREAAADEFEIAKVKTFPVRMTLKLHELVRERASALDMNLQEYFLYVVKKDLGIIK